MLGDSSVDSLSLTSTDILVGEKVERAAFPNLPGKRNETPGDANNNADPRVRTLRGRCRRNADQYLQRKL